MTTINNIIKAAQLHRFFYADDYGPPPFDKPFEADERPIEEQEGFDRLVGECQLLLTIWLHSLSEGQVAHTQVAEGQAFLAECGYPEAVIKWVLNDESEFSIY